MATAALIVNPFFSSSFTLIVTDWMLGLLLETASLVIKDYFIKHFTLQPFFTLWHTDGFTDPLMPWQVFFSLNANSSNS